ncbi:MAG: chemotaxis protein CheW [Firmicutes bacterium]|nr:chemotaxis protein CheW [Bacillota bacterium]
MRGARAFLALRALQEAQITPVGEDPPRAQLANLTPEMLSVRLQADQLKKAQSVLAQVPGIRIAEVLTETAPAPPSSPSGTATPKRPAVRHDRGIRIEAAVLDQLLDRSSESLLLVTQLEHLLRENRTVASFLSRLRVLVSEVNRIVESYRLIPLRSLLANASQVVAETAATLGKEVTLDLDVGTAALDRTAAAALSEPLLHLLRNAVDHGIEAPQQRLAQGKPRQGQVRVQARTDGQRVLLTVEDDGAGIDWKRVRQKGVEKGLLSPAAAEQLDEQALTALLFQPGFSTNEQVTEISGRGVGLDVVQTAVEGQGGRIQVESTLGKGTRFLLYLPVRLTVLEALLVQSDGATFAIALQQVQRCVEVLPEQLVARGGALYWQEGGQLLPYLSLTAWSQRQPSRRPREPQTGVVLLLEGQPLLLGVDALLEEREIVIKPLGGLFSQTAGIRGATILPDGSAAIILDIEGLLALQEKGA